MYQRSKLCIFVLVFTLLAAVTFGAAGKEDTSQTAVEGPQYGGRLTVADIFSGVPPESWDPHDKVWNTSAHTGLYLETLMQGDLQLGPRGSNVTDFYDQEYIPVEYLGPNLAVSWEITPHKYTFHLRKGVMYPEKPGVMAEREFTADDVVFAFNRFYADTPFEQHDIITEVVAEDKYTLSVITTDAAPVWAEWFGYRWVMALIYPPELVEAGISDWKNHTGLGTGPFLLSNYVADSVVSYDRNELYWGKTEIDGKEYDLPFIDGVDRLLIQDKLTRLAGLRSGKIDFVTEIEAVYADDVLKTNPELISTSALSTTVEQIALRFDQKPTNDIRVRQALVLAIDIPEIVKSVYGGQAVITAFPFYPGWGESMYTPLEEMSEAVQKAYLGPRDVDKAKRLLAEAGYPDGFTIRYLTGLSTMATRMNITDMIIAFWSDIGVTLDISQKDSAAMNNLAAERDYDILQWSRTSIPPRTLISDYARPEYIWNTCAIDDERITDIINAIEPMMDGPEVFAMIKETGIWFKEQFAYIGVGAPSVFNFGQPWLNNWFGELNTGYFSYGTVWASLWMDQAMMKDAGR